MSSSEDEIIVESNLDLKTKGEDNICCHSSNSILELDRTIDETGADDDHGSSNES